MTKVAKTGAKKLTVAEQRELLEKQMADLEILEKIEEEITGLAEQYRNYFNNAVTEQIPDGLEEEQAKTWQGELIYEWNSESGYRKTGTEEEVKEAGLTLDDVQPYYRTKYRDEVQEIDDLDSWSRRRAIAYKRLAEFFEGLDITQIGE